MYGQLKKPMMKIRMTTRQRVTGQSRTSDPGFTPASTNAKQQQREGEESVHRCELMIRVDPAAEIASDHPEEDGR